MKLCVFQGTFNPIHNAHLNMAEYIYQNYDFDKIIFIPAHIPPHKNSDNNISIDRLNMVKLATSNKKHFEVSEIEYESNQKSYTYLTIQKLYELYDIDGKINFIIGTDAFSKIRTWYESEKLKNLVDFIVFIRQNEFRENIFDNLRDYNFTFAKMDFEDISSTQIRNNIKSGKSINGLVPNEVERYIKEHGLYKN